MSNNPTTFIVHGTFHVESDLSIFFLFFFSNLCNKTSSQYNNILDEIRVNHILDEEKIKSVLLTLQET